MNLNNLFTKQAELDAYIIKKKGLEGNDLLPNTIFALQVELSECANEWRGFKFWSNDQNPRNYCLMCNVIETPHIHKNPLLEEYIDCIHFMLSIGLTDSSLCVYDFEYTPTYKGSVLQQFQSIFFFLAIFSESYAEGDYETVLTHILGLGEMLGFTWEQIEAAYTAKWEINKQRQENGY